VNKLKLQPKLHYLFIQKTGGLSKKNEELY
jgi:hypothetical protein